MQDIDSLMTPAERIDVIRDMFLNYIDIAETADEREEIIHLKMSVAYQNAIMCELEKLEESIK